VRDGVAIGCKITLRNERMYGVPRPSINVAMPRIRDFRGVSRRSFDGRQAITTWREGTDHFPEINFDSVDAIRGMDIAITTTARTDDHGRALLEAFRFPLRSDR
jgi:large subunit ribosomal protein L5